MNNLPYNNEVYDNSYEWVVYMRFVFCKENRRDIQPIALHKRLRLLRAYNGLRQHEVAEALGIDRSTYTYYELGKTRPDYETLIQIASLYDVSIGFLLGLTDELNE